MRNHDKRLDRYQNDPEFHHLVKTFEHLIYQRKFNYSDLRDAMFVAAMKYEMENPVVRNWIYNNGKLETAND